MASRFLVPFGGRRLAARGDPFLSLHREMNRLFDDTFRSMDDGTAERGGQLSVPQLDIHESEGEFCVTADLPGVEESDIDLRIEGDTLTIRGEKRQQGERDERGYHIMERSSGAFQRTLRLPMEPDPAKVTAECHNGVLTVHIAKEGQQQRSKRIEVKRGARQAAGGQTIETRGGGQSGSNDDQRQVERQRAASESQRSQQPTGYNPSQGQQEARESSRKK
jgi:HSP20 family protein